MKNVNVNKRQRLNIMLDGLCGMLGIEKTDNNKTVITRTLIAQDVDQDYLVDIKNLVRGIIDEEESEKIAEEQVALAQELIYDMCL